MSNQPPAPAAPAPGQAPQPASQPKGLTLDEVRAIAKEESENAFRRSQGYVDKQIPAIKEKIANLEASWNARAAAGTPVDEATKQRELAAAVQIQSAPPAAPQAPQPPAPLAGGAPEAELDPATQIIMDVMEKTGVKLEDNDPEVKAFANKEYKSLLDLAADVQKACDEKKKRTASQPPPTNPAAPPITPGLGSGGTPVSPYEGRHGHELLQEWAKEGK